jgi:hypothetical protein
MRNAGRFFTPKTLGFVFILIPIATSGAQTERLAARSRVRVVATEGLDQSGRPGGVARVLTGSVVSATRDTLVMNVDGQQASTAIPSSHVFALYESEGFHRHVGTGAIVGLGLGLVAGGASGYASGFRLWCDGGPNCDPLTNEDRAVGAAIGGGLLGIIGAGLGAIFGSGSHEHWREIPSERVRAAIVPTQHRARVSFSLSW